MRLMVELVVCAVALCLLTWCCNSDAHPRDATTEVTMI